MSPLYIEQLIAIRSMLNSPLQQIRQDGLELLIGLLRDNMENHELHDEILNTIKNHPDMVAEITNHLQELEKNSSQITQLLVQVDVLMHSLTKDSRNGNLNFNKMVSPNGSKYSISEDVLGTTLLLVSLAGLVGALSVNYDWFTGIIIALAMLLLAGFLLANAWWRK